MLLRAEGVGRRDAPASGMNEIIMIVRSLLTRPMLKAYMTVEGAENNGEELIVRAWKEMLEREGPGGQEPRDLYNLMRGPRNHTRKNHKGCDIVCRYGKRQGRCQAVLGGGVAEDEVPWLQYGVEPAPPKYWRLG